ncbi:unnamed protein product [Caenorhabditis angaria]|uniref:MAM domain-containing protein n=1 Tax=Caenorhabditis angaria TaxID=860376 RepID=A0A9P1N4P0_9PELO|nr:unnamed protein product [Caenorhabditis angaria]
MLIKVIFWTKLLFIFFESVNSCQPPISLGFQNSALPQSVPSYSPAAIAGAAPIDQSAPVPAPPAPSDYNDDSLEMINAAPPGRMSGETRFTPYPGYIPPPKYPTLINDNEVQHSSNTYKSDVPLHIMLNSDNSSSNKNLSCPIEITTMTEFLTCVRRLSTVTQDEFNFSCDFEKDSGCRFKSVSSPLSVGNLPTDDHYRTFATLASRPETQKPTGNFVFFIEHRGAEPEDEFIMSTPITCQRGNGVLKFDYWIVGKHDEVLIRVCTQDHLARSCTQKIGYTTSISTIAIEVVHPNSTFFELEIVASNLIDPTVIVYDNIIYEADMCELENREKEMEKGNNNDELATVDRFFDAEENPDEITGEIEGEEAVQIPTRPVRLAPKKKSELENILDELTRPIEENIDPARFNEVIGSAQDVEMPGTENDNNQEEPETVCKLLDCDFSDSMCFYTNYANESMVLAPWQIGNQRVGNPHTGVKESTGGFLYVGTDSSTSSKIVNYILESPDLIINDDLEMKMDVYRRSNDITLQICLDTPFYCPYTVTPFEKDLYWKDGETFLIPKGTIKIFLRAIQWRRFKWLAIDNIRIVSTKC